MKLCLAQTRPAKGDLARNAAAHLRLIGRAMSHGAEAVFFPELSLTGYEPSLAESLATHPNDPRFAPFQQLSDAHGLLIGLGLPTRQAAGVCISLLLFQPHQPVHTYSKGHLHADEEPFFVSGPNFPVLHVRATCLAPAICYELSVPEHAETAHRAGAQVYVASVAKSASGVETALDRLSDIARTYALPTLMVNAVGPSDDFVSGGRSSVFNAAGELVGQLPANREGLLLYDLGTGEVISTASP